MSGRCAKCGSNDINCIYHAESRHRTRCGSLDHSGSPDEHLHLMCRCCGWDWTEPCRCGTDERVELRFVQIATDGTGFLGLDAEGRVWRSIGYGWRPVPMNIEEEGET